VEDPSAIPGAATARLRGLLAGPARPGVLVHAGRDAAYVELGGRCVGVLSARAVHVPCGIRTTLTSLPRLDRDAPVVAGAGVLTIGPLAVGIARLVDPTPPRTLVEVRAREPRDLRRLLRGPGCEALAGSVTDELPEPALASLRAGDPAAVPALLGRGSGLTPLGDDVLCGWLATTRALDDPARPAVAAEALRLAPARTTVFSAELIACAVDGEVVPQFRRLLAALAAGTGVADALADLVAVGHTSGAGLAHGCLLALDRAAERRAAA
jgi:hypothetical protein